ncbi:MAG: zf-TFIIB domain-containing protein [Elusimicrobia bacterium]|nr:zf-TFIIB domain-containing protein [Elusimicrobiota bacterium]
MRCPVCGKEMVTKNFGVNVDVCENGCKSLWFDQDELRMLDEKNEGLGDALEEALRSPRSNDLERAPVNCPKCSIPLHTHKYNRDKEVNVDECYKCGGFFLDSGELTEIRHHYMNDAEVQAYADQVIASVPEFALALSNLEAQKKRLEAIQHYTKFMTVQYWRKQF